MSLSDIAAVRLKSSDKSNLTNEVAKGDSNSIHFKLAHQQILASPAIEVRKNNILQTLTTHYTVDTTNGVVTFTVAPLDTDDLEFVYYWSIFSDAEVQYFLDAAASNVTIATAQLLLALAADAAKVAKRQAMAGGGGLGSVTLDTSVTARELRAAAQALVEMEKTIGEAIPAEALTEPLWTEMAYKQSLDQRVIRDG